MRGVSVGRAGANGRETHVYPILIKDAKRKCGGGRLKALELVSAELPRSAKSVLCEV
jgi:hypothetical protein